MVFGHKTPVARVERVVAVVTHHEVVIHPEGVDGHRFAIDIEGVAPHFGCGIVFIDADAALIDVPRGGGDLHAHAFAGNQQPLRASVVGTGPVGRNRLGKKGVKLYSLQGKCLILILGIILCLKSILRTEEIFAVRDFAVCHDARQVEYRYAV